MLCSDPIDPARPHPDSAAPRSQDEVDAGSGTGCAKKSLPLHMKRALNHKIS